FDDSFSCTQASRDAKAAETVKETRPPKENGSKTPPANSPVPAPKAAAAASDPGSNHWVKVAKELWAAASQPRSNWGKEFWANQSRWGHGGGDGGGGGGGGGGEGCQRWGGPGVGPRRTHKPPLHRRAGAPAGRTA